MYYFSSLTKRLRGPDEMASRAAFGPQAVVWRPLLYRIALGGALISQDQT